MEGPGETSSLRKTAGQVTDETDALRGRLTLLGERGSRKLF